MTALTNSHSDSKRPYGAVLYKKMLSNFDYSDITWTMKRYNDGMSQKRADELLHAFLQWIAVTPLSNNTRYITMFQTEVEEAFHCFVLNTALYKNFCNQFLGQFFHHNPLIEQDGPDVEAAAKYTVQSLEQAYGDDLHPELKNWRRQFNEGTYEVACVGPGGSCP